MVIPGDVTGRADLFERRRWAGFDNARLIAGGEMGTVEFQFPSRGFAGEKFQEELFEEGVE